MQQFYLLKLLICCSSSREAGQELQVGPEVESMETCCLLAMNHNHTAVLISPVPWGIYFSWNFIFTNDLSRNMGFCFDVWLFCARKVEDFGVLLRKTHYIFGAYVSTWKTILREMQIMEAWLVKLQGKVWQSLRNSIRATHVILWIKNLWFPGQLGLENQLWLRIDQHH